MVLLQNQTDSIFEADKLHSELRILDWILYQVCSNEIKKFFGINFPEGRCRLEFLGQLRQMSNLIDT
jgi:hypothetical protein